MSAPRGVSVPGGGGECLLWGVSAPGGSAPSGGCRASSNRNGQKNRKIGIRAPKK